MKMKSKRRFVAIILSFVFSMITCVGDNSIYIVQAAQSEEAEIILTTSSVATWSNQDGDYSQFSVTIQNNGEETESNWTFSMKFESEASLTSGWCGDYTMDNGTLTVSSLSYNSEIASGESITFGFIIENPGSYDTDLATAVFESDNQTVTSDPTEPEASAEVSYEPVDFETLASVSYKKKDLDAAWSKSSSEAITFSEDTVSYDGANATVDGTCVTIQAGGTYVISGNCSDGQIIINSNDDNLVHIVLNGLSLTSKANAAIYVESADKTVVTLAEDSVNILEDAEEYTYEDDSTVPKAAIYSKDDLTFNGTGSLKVTGNYKNGIQCKDKLKFVSGSYDITSADDAIVGKDLVGIMDGTFTLNAGGDGIKSTNEKDAESGFVEILDGDFTITSVNDAIQGETNVVVSGGTFDITTNDGYENGREHTTDDMMGMFTDMPFGSEGPTQSGTPQATDAALAETEGASTTEQPETTKVPSESTKATDTPTATIVPEVTEPQTTETVTADTTDTTDTTESETESAKGLKAGVAILVRGGTFDFNTADDAIHSNNSVLISDGTITMDTGDDGIHADNALIIEDGKITISNCYEGLEGLTITVNGGDTDITASDDGVNGSDGSGSEMGMQGGDISDWEDLINSTTFPSDMPMWSENPMPSDFSGMDGMGGGMGMMSSGNAAVIINGGNLTVKASGDGLDSNGSLTITGGTIVVNGPDDGGNGALDYDTTCEITGGILVAAGNKTMAQGASDTSTQASILMNYEETQSSNSVACLKDSDGNTILAFNPSEDYDSIVISTPEMKNGETYTLYTGSTEKENSTLLSDDEFTLGDVIQDIEMTSIVTSINADLGGFMNGGVGGNDFFNQMTTDTSATDTPATE